MLVSVVVACVLLLPAHSSSLGRSAGSRNHPICRAASREKRREDSEKKAKHARLRNCFPGPCGAHPFHGTQIVILPPGTLSHFPAGNASEAGAVRLIRRRRGLLYSYLGSLTVARGVLECPCP